jgi:hypothetical protein
MNADIIRIIKDVLAKYDEKAALKKLCSELENMGYEVRIDGRVSSEVPENQDYVSPVTFSLYNFGVLEKEFSISFSR